MYINYDLLTTIADENAKCRRIVWKTTDETLVRAGMRKLGFGPEAFLVEKVKQSTPERVD